MCLGWISSVCVVSDLCQFVSRLFRPTLNLCKRHIGRNMMFSPAYAFLGLLVVASSLASEDHPKPLSAREEVEQIRELARMIRQTENPSDLTVQNLLQWLQGRYEASGIRRARQQTPSREYLPSYQTNNNGGLNKPRPFQRPGGQNQQVQGQLGQAAQQGQDSLTPQGPYPQPSDQPGFDAFSNEVTSKEPQYNFPSRPNFNQEDAASTISPVQSTKYPDFSSSSPIPGFVVEESQSQNSLSPFSPDDPNHPPHIHALDVQCAKDMMTITIEFNRVFNGVIYSKGFYNSEKCRYVTENSNQQVYTFKVSLDSCGTQFIDQFQQGGQAYLENVLVLQNEPGIQEVWDTVRTVRCSWEGSIRQDLSVSLVIGMLTQEVVTFNGDTGKARLDIQVGKGPFAAPANGVVKIGEPMTLVVYVEGDPEFDVVVRQCQARDSTGEKSIQLFDERGCVLKPKLFGAFQKTRETGNTGASLIAFAYFSAFKFPDEMDLVIECNVELCKANCEMCPEEQKLEPGRRRRDVSSNETMEHFGKRVSGRFRVLAEEDLTALEIREHLLPAEYKGICMSTQSFVFSSLLILVLLMISSITSATMWFKLQTKWQQNKC